ncbi:MAG TPA: LCP family protein [Actinomycetota bacterium]|nr:LCP family protein [Actinomycetota bacterium]
MTALIQNDPATRANRRKSLRRRRVWRRVLVVVLILAVAGGAGYVVERKATHKAKSSAGGSVVPQNTVLVAMTSHGDATGQATALTLLGVDRTGKNPVTLFIPVDALAPIPGAKDFDLIGKALSNGNRGLEQITVENMMGIDVDRTVSFDDVSLGVFIDQLGGIDVNVQEKLYSTQPDGTRTLAFQLGQHHMNGAAAVTYLTFKDPSLTELDSFVRAQKIWDGIFNAASNAVKLSSAISSFGGAQVAAEDGQWFQSILKAFAASSVGDRTYQVLPGQAIGAGDADSSYQVDDQKVADLVRADFAGSVPYGVTIGQRARVELRNGNGAPQLGQKAAALLVPAGLRIEVTGNAPTFDYQSTRIVVYSDDATGLALGQEIRNLLGVGRVEVGTRAETVVDVTVVLGRDFLTKTQEP